MEPRLFVYTLCVYLLWCVHLGFAVPVLRTTPAGEIQGYTDHVVADGVTKDITRFLGIPYAEPPTGTNRFEKPVPKSRFNNVLVASNNNNACVQSSKMETEEFSEFVSNFTEDCLTLNVYVPSNFSDDSSAASLQTMVWIHGGGFTADAAAGYHPDILSVTTNTIVVTVNYRVGMFGFLQSKDGKFKGNQGLWDQHLGLKWVSQNIGMFYGSPATVTIFGESAGGASVLYQALYPGNQGLFQRVIANSGSSLAHWALMKAPNAEKYFQAVGCMTSDPLACLSSKTHEELQVSDSVKFKPVVDGDFLSESPERILFGNDAASQTARDFYYSLDILTGVNQYDGAITLKSWSNFVKGLDINDPHITREQLKNELFFNMLDMNEMDKTRLLLNLMEFEYINWSDPDSYNTTRQAAIDLSNDLFIFYAAIRTAQSHLANKASHSKTYFYEFCPKPTTSLTPDWITGANHFDEVGELFGYPLQANPPIAFTKEEKQMSRVIMTLWSNFAKTGHPNKPFDVSQLINTTWPEYDMTSQKYLELSNHMSADSVKSHFHARRMRFWSDIVPSILNSRHQTSITTTTTTSISTTLIPLLRNLYISMVCIIMLS